MLGEMAIMTGVADMMRILNQASVRMITGAMEAIFKIMNQIIGFHNENDRR